MLHQGASLLQTASKKVKFKITDILREMLCLVREKGVLAVTKAIIETIVVVSQL
jgi:hypothetical protein